MSLSISPYELPLEQEYDASVDEGAPMIREERSRWQPLVFLLPGATAAVSWAAGGAPLLTDLCFLMIAIICAVFLIGEFRAFSFRWGIGGMLVYGGVLVWFCQDYFHNFFGKSLFDRLNMPQVPAETVARAAMFHVLFIIMMILGLRIRLKDKLENFLRLMPDPGSEAQYVMLIGGLWLFGMSPYVFFTANHNPLEAFWADVMGGRAGGAIWTAGRTGNVNFNYGAYLAQVLQVGQMASILGGFYAVCIARSWLGRLFGFAVWVPTAMLAFGSGTRGNMVSVMLPMVGFAFLKFQARAADAGRRVSKRGYMILGTLLLAMLVTVQIQITFRGSGFQDADLSQVSERTIEGNRMFSESLRGFELIPKYQDAFYAKYPGEGLAMAIPDQVFWFFVSPIPRAIWTNKPVDAVWQWYNNTVAGTTGTEGTTISNGAVGHWYFRYGFWGVVEGGLFVGFLMGTVERLLRNGYRTSPMAIVVSLAIATFLFRAYRGLVWIEFHGTLVGLVSLAIAVWFIHVFFGNPRATSVQ